MNSLFILLTEVKGCDLHVLLPSPKPSFPLYAPYQEKIKEVKASKQATASAMARTARDREGLFPGRTFQVNLYPHLMQVPITGISTFGRSDWRITTPR